MEVWLVFHYQLNFMEFVDLLKYILHNIASLQHSKLATLIFVTHFCMLSPCIVHINIYIYRP